jgi:hypothetical protein
LSEQWFGAHTNGPRQNQRCHELFFPFHGFLLRFKFSATIAKKRTAHAKQTEEISSAKCRKSLQRDLRPAGAACWFPEL